MGSVKITAPAKINLSLEITKRLPSGYHQMRSVMLKLPRLADELEFKLIPDNEEITLFTNSADVPLDERNLCYKSAQAFFKKTGINAGVEIRIKKTIPLSAGLGGGSTNAAATFIALNALCSKPLSTDQLMKLAAPIGKDIPFFFSDKHAALVDNMGERIKGTVHCPPLHILLVNPRIHINTAWAYGEISQSLWYMHNKNRMNYSEALFYALNRKRTRNIHEYLHNDFEAAIIAHHPVIAELKQSLRALGAKGSLMSGSGSTVFGIFETAASLKKAEQILKKQYPEFFFIAG